MPQFGEVRVDFITFTTGVSPDEANVTVPVSGLLRNPTFSGNVIISGDLDVYGDITNSGNYNTVTGNITTTGGTISGAAGQFTTLTGGTAGFTTVTGTTVTGTTANFVTVSGTTVTGDAAAFTSITGGTAGFTTVTGTTVTGTTANFAAVSGTTITGDTGNFTTATITSGVFASGTAAAPSVSVGTTDNGLYSPGTDEVALATNGSGALFVDSTGNVGVGSAAPGALLDANGLGRFLSASPSYPASGKGLEIYFDSAGDLGYLQAYDRSGSAWKGLTFAGDTIRFRTSGNEVARIDSSGRLLVGTSSARTGVFSFAPVVQIEGTSADNSRLIVCRNSNSQGAEPALILGKSRSTSNGSNTIVQDDDRIGALSFSGADGTQLIKGCEIRGEIDGTPGADDMPGRLVFSTTADGASSPTERLSINNSGAFGVAGANFGTAGQALVSNGSAAPPTWQSITPTTVFGWNHTNDNYGLYLPGTSIRSGDFSGTVDIDVQSRLRRCVINDAGVVQYYLDADDSDLKSGDWLRIVETEALDTAYTGTISESTNSLLRVGVPAWAAGTFTLGQRVTHSGSLWECIAATTTATPAAGTVSSVLDGTDGQVVVEVPAFSVRYGFLNGVHTREVRLGCSDSLIAQGFQPHPAFIKTDGTYKDAFYIGAYHTYDDSGTGSSVSGQTNTRSQTRATFRTEAEARGTGWHVLSYLELAAIQTLLVCEFRDYNSQKVIGNGSDAGATYGVTTGQSDGDGNHSVNSTDNVSNADDYMAYRGIENLYGRAWQFVDGINVYDRVVYLTNDQTAFADNTADGYEFYAQVPTGSSSYQKELHPLADVFLPSVVTGASSTSYLGDAFWSSTGWRVAGVGGSSVVGARVGAFTLDLDNTSSLAGASLGARLAFASN